MDSRYVFVYAAVNVFCILVSFIILSKISYNVGTEGENRYFRGMVLCFFGFVFLEFLWVLGIGGVLPIPLAVASSFKALSTILIPLMVFLWFWFAEVKFKSRIAGSRIARYVSFIPFLVLIGFYIVSIFNGVVFGLDADGQLVPGPLAGLTGLVDNIYGIAIIVHAIILFAKEKRPYRRKDYITQIVFIVLCTAGGIIDAVVSNTPVMPLAIALAFVFLFANLQENQIYNDALTGMNNRRRADEYLIESIEDTSDEKPLHVFILDIDNFKSINDTYGHLEGDRALRATARGIGAATDEFHGFAARWGGDEFIIAINGNEADLEARIRQSVQENVDHAVRAMDISYPLVISIGAAVCRQNTCKLADIIAVADAALYEEKRVHRLAT